MKIRAGGGSFRAGGGALGQQGAPPCYSSLWETLITIFRHVGSSQKVKLLTTSYVIYQLISQYNYKYIFVKIERSKMSELSQMKFPFFLRKNETIHF